MRIARPVDRAGDEAVAQPLERDPVAVAEEAEQQPARLVVGIARAGQADAGMGRVDGLELEEAGDPGVDVEMGKACGALVVRKTSSRPGRIAARNAGG